MRRAKTILLWAVLVLLVDQAAKWWLTAALPVGRSIELTAWLNLVHWHNPGAAFGLLASGKLGWLMVLLSGLGVLVLIVVSLRVGPVSKWGRLGLGLALGGAAGNLVDRLRFGQVTDFLDFHWGSYHWPAFNVADAALSTGFVILALIWIRRG